MALTAAQARNQAIAIAKKFVGSALSEDSVKAIVATEIAKVVAEAPEDFDTLKEISDWIYSHADDAAEMNSAIKDLQKKINAIDESLDDISNSLG